MIKVGRRSQIEENISERKEKVPYARGMRGGGRDGPTLACCPVILKKRGRITTHGKSSNVQRALERGRLCVYFFSSPNESVKRGSVQCSPTIIIIVLVP